MRAASDASLYHLCFKLMLRSKHAWAAIAEQNGLTLVQLHAIGLLMVSEAVPMVRLSTLLSCDASYVTGIVDRLEEQGIVERRENPQDRRVKMVALTDKGQQVRETVEQYMHGVQEEIFSRLTKAE